MKQNSILERLTNGILSENPTFVLMLGMCPTLAVTTSAVNGLGMGLTTMVVLAMSNMFISLLRNIIPDKVRIPAFIVVIASFVTVVELLLKAYIPFLYDALGLYIPLIVVNCIILGRAEAYASKNGIVLSLFDGIGMGLGFTMALTIIGAVRELIGAGEVFGYAVMPESYVPCSIFVLAPGAFFVLAALTAIQNKIKIAGEKKGKDMSKIGSGCSEDCMNCGEKGCSKRFYDTSGDIRDNVEEKLDALEDKAEEILDKVEDKIDEIKDKAEDKLEEIEDKIENKVDELKDKLEEKFDKDDDDDESGAIDEADLEDKADTEDKEDDEDKEKEDVKND